MGLVTKLLFGTNAMSCAFAMNQAKLLYNELPNEGLPYRDLGPDHVNVTRILYDSNIPNVYEMLLYIADKYQVELRLDSAVEFGVTDWDINL